MQYSAVQCCAPQPHHFDRIHHFAFCERNIYAHVLVHIKKYMCNICYLNVSIHANIGTSVFHVVEIYVTVFNIYIYDTHIGKHITNLTHFEKYM